ncbi:hypothetical protein [Thetidibacter halocola]|uniref:Uncharacterized protein n=1 Tax=Thetidibacter halocola TaxID=2827239 RepID=A0A8J7WFU1_9RHOB|nr:hypothetical protein [Thetidibacter halocola]MBS0126895.1 hypothetical protein [Thetidibacter halocola]
MARTEMIQTRKATVIVYFRDLFPNGEIFVERVALRCATVVVNEIVYHVDLCDDGRVKNARNIGW